MKDVSKGFEEFMEKVKTADYIPTTKEEFEGNLKEFIKPYGKHTKRASK